MAETTATPADNSSLTSLLGNLLTSGSSVFGSITNAQAAKNNASAAKNNATATLAASQSNTTRYLIIGACVLGAIGAVIWLVTRRR